MKALAPVIMFFWIISSLYFGVGGVISIEFNQMITNEFKQSTTNLSNDEEHGGTDSVRVMYKNMEFKNKDALKSYIKYIESSKSLRFFPWTEQINDFTALVITSVFFGMLGACIKILSIIALTEKKLSDLKFVSIPILGFLTGFPIIGLTYVVPNVLVENAENIRPISLVFFCLFAGAFSERFYSKLNDYFLKIFP